MPGIHVSMALRERVIKIREIGDISTAKVENIVTENNRFLTVRRMFFNGCYSTTNFPLYFFPSLQETR